LEKLRGVHQTGSAHHNLTVIRTGGKLARGDGINGEADYSWLCRGSNEAAGIYFQPVGAADRRRGEADPCPDIYTNHERSARISWRAARRHVELRAGGGESHAGILRDEEDHRHRASSGGSAD